MDINTADTALCMWEAHLEAFTDPENPDPFSIYRRAGGAAATRQQVLDQAHHLDNFWSWHRDVWEESATLDVFDWEWVPTALVRCFNNYAEFSFELAEAWLLEVIAENAARAE